MLNEQQEDALGQLLNISVVHVFANGVIRDRRDIPNTKIKNKKQKTNKQTNKQAKKNQTKQKTNNAYIPVKQIKRRTVRKTNRKSKEDLVSGLPEQLFSPILCVAPSCTIEIIR